MISVLCRWIEDAGGARFVDEVRHESGARADHEEGVGLIDLGRSAL